MWIKAVIIFNTLIPFIYSQISESCTSENKCTEIINCEPALQQLRAKRSHDLEVCGYSGDIQMVCCPITVNKFGNPDNNNKDKNDVSNSLDNKNSIDKAKRTAERECEKIKEKAIAPLDLHILGGEAASLGEFPHMVALGYNIVGEGYGFDCGGSVVSPTYVLTAAHCIKTRSGVPPTIVRGGIVELGNKNWNSKTDTRIAETILHPQYNSLQRYHDIALLRLETPLEFSSNLNAVCLETSDEDPKVPLTVTGWGQTSNQVRQRSVTLLKANVTAVPRGTCDQSFAGWDWQQRLPNGIIGGHICAGDPKGIRDTCQGDSGGPLSIALGEGLNRLVGVTSYGRGCGSPLPALYTRVSYYLDWIENIVWPN